MSNKPDARAALDTALKTAIEMIDNDVASIGLKKLGAARAAILEARKEIAASRVEHEH